MNPMSHPKHRLASELLATADALRTSTVNLQNLERANHPDVAGHPEMTILHAHTKDVVGALVGRQSSIDG